MNVPPANVSETQEIVTQQSRLSGISLRRAFLIVLALGYAFLAGLRTVYDADLPWQLATGGWMAEHHRIPFTDVLSYTARGHEWIYPALSQILLYGSYRLGGYSLLSWLGAVACVGAVAILLRRGSAPTLLLAVIAVPMIANRTTPRAEMFSTVLFAAFLSILWNYHRSGRGPLWLLPALMCLWVNLHLGFVAGLGLWVAYLVLEFGDGVFPSRRKDSLLRLRRSAPWLVATAIATLCNPWGARIYVALARQNSVQALHGKLIGEWVALPITVGRFVDIAAWREPQSALLWLIIVGILATIIAAAECKAGPALLLAGSTYLVLHAMRFEALFAAVVVIIAGAVIGDGLENPHVQRALPRATEGKPLVPALGTLIVFLPVACLFGVRAADLVTNRYYLRTSTQVAAFGPGQSYWFPERAAEFLSHEHLPANLFNDYASGGFVAWKLAPESSDYIDGRAVPFGSELFLHSLDLLSLPLDSPQWQAEAANRNIHTLIISLDHRMGSQLSSLGQFCQSRQWRPVFLDPHGAVFVRIGPDTASLVSRLQLDCSQVLFNDPLATAGGRGDVERFNYYLNAATILVVLNRHGEALNALAEAEKIFSENGYLHYTKGIALHNLGRTAEAEQELRTATELDTDDAAPLALARQYEQQRRYADEAQVLKEAAGRSFQPYWLYLRLGYAQLQLNLPQDALASFQKAENESPFTGEAYALGAGFYGQIAEGRRLARRSLGME